MTTLHNKGISLKYLFRGVLLFLLLGSGSKDLVAQNHIFSATFTNGQTPTAQCTQWTAWRATLTPGQYLGVTFRGSANPGAQVGVTCNDPAMANALANAIKLGLQYTSPVCGGRIWYLCDRYGGELWIDAPSLCNGSNCPDPAYIMRVCIGNLNWGGANTPTCTSNPTQVMELIFIRPSAPNDIGIASIDSPKDFCAGTLPVKVTLKNFGTLPVSSAIIHWTLNGVPKPSFNWTGLLDTLNASTRETLVTIGTETFSNGVPYTIKAWSSMPNNVADTVNLNDTLTVTRQAAMSGVYTIGGIAPHFSTFTAAVSALTQNGVCGPVAFKVRSGTYTEQVTIAPVSGASAVNTVSFEAETGNRNDVTLTNNTTNATLMWVLSLNGCNFVTFRNMTITATNTTYGRGVYIQGGSRNSTLENMNLNGVNTTSTSSNFAIFYNLNASREDSTIIRGCTFRWGSYALIMGGGGSVTSLESGTIIENNTIQDFSYMGLQANWQNSPLIKGNTIISSKTTAIYQFWTEGCNNRTRVLGNRIFAPVAAGIRGMYVYNCTSTPGNEGVYANNMVYIFGGGSGTDLLFLNTSTNQKFCFNTFYTNSTSASSRPMRDNSGGSNITLKNNIFYNAGAGPAIYVIVPAAIVESDYNVFYSGGANLAYWSGNRANLAALQAASGKDANSITKPITFKDLPTGDLHLAGASENDVALTGLLMPEVTDDYDGDPRVIPYRGADEACYITPGSVTALLVDGTGMQTPFANLPGTVGVKYHVAFPDFDANITITLNFYTIPGNMLAYSSSFNVFKLVGIPLDGTEMVAISSIPPGMYRVQIVFNTKNSCNSYRDYMIAEMVFMILPQGAVPCIVWPGDVDNDGVVNYNDRKSLNVYIHDANLSPVWLNGPGRYRLDAVSNPLSYLTWEPQASVPWQTPEGCYMDTDGNGVVNNFDYIAIKLNWMKQHGGVAPRSDDSFTPTTFDMSQNFPNPFNPTTAIQYSVPEPSRVHLRIVDMLGCDVAVAVDGIVEAGVRLYTFDASSLPSGQYMAIVTMTGNESGLSFSKSIKMTLNK